MESLLGNSFLHPRASFKSEIAVVSSKCHPVIGIRVSSRLGISKLWEPIRRCGASVWQRHALAEAKDRPQEDEVLRRRSCECHDQYNLLVPYVDAWQWQKLCVEEKVAMLAGGEDFDDTLIVLQHPPVYTLGTRSSEANLKFDANDPPFELHRTERGGEVTYHGPGQLVLYPILNLRYHHMDLHWYLRTLEQVLIGALDKACGISAHRIDGLTGVWVANQKVAAIGVRVSRWITYHGLALNVTTDLSPFSNIIPCGISDYSVTSVAKLLENSCKSSQVNGESLLKLLHDCLLEEFASKFNLHLVPPAQRGPKQGVRPFL